MTTIFSPSMHLDQKTKAFRVLGYKNYLNLNFLEVNNNE